MNDRILHTPEGVRDLYGEELARKKHIERALHKRLASFGYQPIQTPTFEFFDVFGSKRGTSHAKSWYKFFDREGNTLVLRPDITPSIARAAAKYFTEEDRAIRLSYQGNIFDNNSSYQGHLKESTQLGAELIGDPSVDADAEMIALVVCGMQAIGFLDFQISVTHADLLSGLMDACRFDDDNRERIQSLIENHNRFGLQEYLEEESVPADLAELFDSMTRIYNSPTDWADLTNRCAAYPKITEAFDRLEQIYEILKIYGVDSYVSFEPGLLASSEYYTGLIFAGYTFGSGQAFVRGGRYDQLLSYFGKNAAAIGFAFSVDRLMLAASSQELEIEEDGQDQLVLYHRSQRVKALRLAHDLRQAGQRVTLISCEDTRDLEAEKSRYAGARLTCLI